MRKAICIAALLALAACQYPASRTEQGASPGQVYFTGVPPTTGVAIDGQSIGATGSYDSGHVLAVQPGTHRIVLTAESSNILDKKYYVGSGSVVEVHP
jgi:hypothetical protein